MENLKTKYSAVSAIYCQLCGLTNSKEIECELYNSEPHEINMDELTRIYIRRIDRLIDVIKTGKPLNIYYGLPRN